MEKVNLKANIRNNLAKSSRNLLRKSGRVPGVFYSKHNAPIAIDVAENSIKPLIFTSSTHLIALQLEGKDEFDCVIKDVQFDPVTDRIIHFDLIGLTKGEKLQLEVPLQLIGTPVGIKEGGILQVLLHKLEIECLPKDIPQQLEIDISQLKVGDSIHIKDLKYENIKILHNDTAVVVSVVHPKVEKEPVPAEEGLEQAEPEVISKGKEEESSEENEE
ncbi:MAG: 50S ribosomal protein L25 [Ignavibacteriaceae bacterium]